MRDVAPDVLLMLLGDSPVQEWDAAGKTLLQPKHFRGDWISTKQVQLSLQALNQSGGAGDSFWLTLS